jgi:serpin B
MNTWGAQRRLRILGGAAAALVLVSVAACSVPIASATPRSSSPTFEPTPWDTMWTASPTATPSQPSRTPGALPSFANDFPLATGQAPTLVPATDNGAAAGTDINAFGLELMRHLNPKGNLVFSPTSVALALAMVEPGARGETLAQLDKLLNGLGSDSAGAELTALQRDLTRCNVYAAMDGSPYVIDPDDTSPPYSPLPGETMEPDAVIDPSQPAIDQLSIANQVFLQKGMSVNPDYLNALGWRFGAGAGMLDFAVEPEAARQTINKWASDRTYGLIPEILQPGDLDAMTRFELINAIYLKAHWQQPFDPANTKALPFYRAGGSSVKVPTMAITLDEAAYAAGSGWRAIRIPNQNRTSMTVVVPASMSSYLAGLTAAKLSALLPANGPVLDYVADLTLPKFSTQTRTDLAATLSTMGARDAFDSSKADFSGIDGRLDLSLGSVIHQARIDVDEKGETAAAVTDVSGRGGAGPVTYVTFHIDHPFLYFIRDDVSGTILFMGRVDDPSLS